MRECRRGGTFFRHFCKFLKIMDFFCSIILMWLHQKKRKSRFVKRIKNAWAWISMVVEIIAKYFFVVKILVPDFFFYSKNFPDFFFYSKNFPERKIVSINVTNYDWSQLWCILNTSDDTLTDFLLQLVAKINQKLSWGKFEENRWKLWFDRFNH